MWSPPPDVRDTFEVGPGDSLELTVVRGSEERTITVTFPADEE